MTKVSKITERKQTRCPAQQLIFHLHDAQAVFSLGLSSLKSIASALFKKRELFFVIRGLPHFLIQMNISLSMIEKNGK